MTAGVSLLIVTNGSLGIAPAEDDRDDAGITEYPTQLVGIAAFAGEQVTHAPRALEKRGRSFHVADVAGRELQRIGAAMTSVNAWTLVVKPPRERPIAAQAPPFAPNAAGCLHVGAVGRDAPRHPTCIRQRVQQLESKAPVRPAVEPVVVDGT